MYYRSKRGRPEGRPYTEKSARTTLEARRMVGGDGEGAFEGHAGAAESAFVEEEANQSDAVGNAAGRREFRQGMLRVGCPVRARFGDFDKASAKRERGVASVVADGEHFVAERRNEEQVDVGENARHFLADFAAEAVGLNEIHCGEKTGLAEKIGPGVVRLHFELIDTVGERELLERGGSFGEEIEIEGAVRPVREKDFDGVHAEFMNG